MINYIKSELYRILHSKGAYIFIGICSALLIAANIVLAVCKLAEPSFPYATTVFSTGTVMSSMTFVYILCITVAALVFGNEHTNHTMKNTVSYGITRGTLYFGKLIVQIIYAIVAFTIIIGAHLASAYLLLENSPVNEIIGLLRLSLVCLPLLLFALAATNCFYFIIEGTGLANTLIIGLLMGLPIASSFLGMKFKLFRDLNIVLPWNLINKIGIEGASLKIVLPWEGNTGYYNYWIYGMVQFLLITIIGYVVFRKKEIK